jgi:hypothetical protein
MVKLLCATKRKALQALRDGCAEPFSCTHATIEKKRHSVLNGMASGEQSETIGG